MATNFESIYEKFLLQIDDYELGIIQENELNNVCFGYLEKARALHFPQCSKDLEDVTINYVTYINGERVEEIVDEEPPLIEVPVTEEVTEQPLDEELEVNEIDEADEAVEVPSEPTEEPATPNNDVTDQLTTEDESLDIEQIEDDVFVKIEGMFNFDLTNAEQQILALGMKKSWLSSKKFSADLMSKDIGDRDYKAVQGFNYIKELRALDSELEEEIRKYGVQYTYSIEELSTGW